MEPKPSPLPWISEQEDYGGILDADGRYVIHYMDGTVADRKFILRSTAAHAALVEALKLALEMAETYYGYYESEFRVSSDSPDLEYHAKLAQIAAALALAEPQK